MTCNCHKEIEAKLLAHFKEVSPEATDHKVELQGYGLAIIDNVLTLKPYMPYIGAAEFPMKKGGTKYKKQTGNMVFSFCPFCGDKLDKSPALGVRADVAPCTDNPKATCQQPDDCARYGCLAAPAHHGVAVVVPPGRALPHPGSPEASAMMDSMLAEYQWPANSKNAARAGWEAANRWLTSGVKGLDDAQP